MATTLSRLAREGELQRTGKGVYYRPAPTSFGLSIPGASAAAAQTLNAPLHPAGLSAANALGLTTQNPKRPEYATPAPGPPTALRNAVIHTRRPAARAALSPEEGAILEILRERARSSDLQPYSGFGSHQMLHTPKVEELTQPLPIRIEFVETAEKVEEVLPTLYEMVTDGLIEVQDTTVVKLAHKSTRPEPMLPHERQQGQAKLLRVFIGEADKWHDEPLYDAIVKKLRMMDMAGATVYRGILGYGAKGHQHKTSFFHVSRDMPIMMSVIDSPEKIAAAAEAIEGMLEDGLIVISDVDMVRLVRSRKVMEAPDAAGPKR